MANMNRSRKRHEQGRKIPSRLRTLGRINRYESRHPIETRAGTQDMLGELNGQPVVLEIKTGEVPNGQA